MPHKPPSGQQWVPLARDYDNAQISTMIRSAPHSTRTTVTHSRRQRERCSTADYSDMTAAAVVREVDSNGYENKHKRSCNIGKGEWEVVAKSGTKTQTEDVLAVIS